MSAALFMGIGELRGGKMALMAKCNTTQVGNQAL
ncbi:hypothetical protein BSPWISOXPB_8545 [uncultured Gammaproteobacteria bacterium]|nr:hypothetical protein BSPWISOXPB_8545 [uncultured Gammaproteobacteria bacterium]